MLTEIHPKLPMRNKRITQDYYIQQLGFQLIDNQHFEEYLMIKKDKIEIHFFLFPDLDKKNNDGQVYIRTNNIDQLYQDFLDRKIVIHPNGQLALKPWGQYEFSILDPDNNLLTFGQNYP